RSVEAALLEILITGGALLPIPALLIGDRDCRQDGETLDGKCNVREISDGAMSILKVESIEKLLGILFADLLQRLLHGKRRARVFGHGVGLHLWVDTMDGEDIDLRSFEFRVSSFGGSSQFDDLMFGSGHVFWFDCHRKWPFQQVASK